MNERKAPEIRFKGFTDDWEQRKLEDYIIEYHEVTTENNQYPALTSSRKGIFLQTEYFAGNQIASDDNTGYNIVPYGYFTYRHMSDDEIFHFNINDIVENGIVSTLYPVFTTNDKLDSRYLQYQLNYGYEFARFAVLQKQGGSRTYMYLSKLKQLSLTMPKDVEEQKKISGFLMELDNLITLHQRKHKKLLSVKKTMLEKMFPQNGAKVPEIRFEGFTDDWEQRKLGDLMDVGSVKRVHQSDWRDSGVRFLRARDVVADFNNEEPDDYLYIDQKMYEEYSAQSGKVQQGDLLVTGVGTIGIPMLIKSEKPLYFKDGNIIWFKNKNAIDGQFFYYSFISKGIQDFIKESAGIGTVGTYTIDSGKKTPINLPTSIEEQKEIGIYFKNLDHLITLHHRELDKLVNIKKSMLEKMLV